MSADPLCLNCGQHTHCRTLFDSIINLLATPDQLKYLSTYPLFPQPVKSVTLAKKFSDVWLATNNNDSKQQSSTQHRILLFLVPGSSHVKDALGDAIPPAPPVLHSLYNLIPADSHFPVRSLLTTPFQLCDGRPVLLLKPSGSHGVGDLIYYYYYIIIIILFIFVFLIFKSTLVPR